MNTGQIISGVGHLGLIGWAMLAGVFISDPTPVEVTNVTSISGEEFAALVARSEEPETAQDVTTPEAPEVETAPDIGSEADPAPQVTQPEITETAPPDETPELTEVLPPADAEVSDEAPELTPPVQDVVVPLPEISEEARPESTPRVAPEPAAQPEPDVRIDDIAQPEAAPDEAAETPREETEETAPEAASPEIVTEAAEPPSAAPVTSLRPKTRPSRPEPVETAQPAEPETPRDTDAAEVDNAVENALAEALGDGQTGTAAPSGPPLSRGEKDALRVAVQKCWNVGSLSSDALQSTVVIAVSLSQDGKPIAGSIRQLSATGGTAAGAKKAFEAARRAVSRCGAKGFKLPSDKYEQWRDIEMTFNPENMRIK